MKTRILAVAAPALLSLWFSSPAMALEGEPFIHDPSTVIKCDGKFYTFGTGSGGLMSDDGWTWHSGAVRTGGGVAPDVIKIGDRYLVSYADGGPGEHVFRVHTMWTKTLDPQSPDFGYQDDTVVVSTDVTKECDAIDPALLLDPTDGRLWLSYGTYFGFIQIVELDPKNGKRVEGNQPVNVAIDCEATDLIYRDGWYYLLGTHGTCCNGPTSTYNIRVGRSRKVTGPYLDNIGRDMLWGGGKLLIAANGRYVGPGHFGLTDLGDGVQKFSCHYEADLDRGGRSILDVRALLWKDGWPVAGENFLGGTFEIESVRSGYALELGVEAVPLGGVRRGMMGLGGGGRGRGGAPGGTNALSGTNSPGGRGMVAGMGMGGRGGGNTNPIPAQEVAVVSTNWPTGNVGIRIGDYMLQAHQKWTITPVANVGGYLGSPFFKITIAATDRALAATAEGEVVAVPAFTGSPEQLWQIDQLIDGTYRISPKLVPNSKDLLALIAIGDSTPTLAKFDFKSDNGRWNFKKP